eukprot:3542937-Rhodomonas_salina.4
MSVPQNEKHRAYDSTVQRIAKTICQYRTTYSKDRMLVPHNAEQRLRTVCHCRRTHRNTKRVGLRACTTQRIARAEDDMRIATHLWSSKESASTPTSRTRGPAPNA